MESRDGWPKPFVQSRMLHPFAALQSLVFLDKHKGYGVSQIACPHVPHGILSVSLRQEEGQCRFTEPR